MYARIYRKNFGQGYTPSTIMPPLYYPETSDINLVARWESHLFKGVGEYCDQQRSCYPGLTCMKTPTGDAQRCTLLRGSSLLDTQRKQIMFGLQ